MPSISDESKVKNERFRCFQGTCLREHGTRLCYSVLKGKTRQKRNICFFIILYTLYCFIASLHIRVCIFVHLYTVMLRLNFDVLLKCRTALQIYIFCFYFFFLLLPINLLAQECIKTRENEPRRNCRRLRRSESDLVRTVIKNERGNCY